MTADRSPRHVLVTGGSSGLGAAVTDQLLARGDHVAVLDRAPASRPGAIHVQVDLADGAAVVGAVANVRSQIGRLDAIVTAAGIDECGPFGEIPRDDWERVIAVNLLGTAAVVRAGWPDVARPGGRVVVVASTLGRRALPDATAYCASKFGVVGFARALAAESRGRPAVTCLLPGGMATPFFDDRPEQYRPGPDAKLNDPAYVARSVLFALDQPEGCDVRELLICPSEESSWP